MIHIDVYYISLSIRKPSWLCSSTMSWTKKENCRRQIMWGSVFSPLWTFWCVLRFPICVKPLPHKVHLYGFFPVWITRCLFSEALVGNCFPHVVQIYVFGALRSSSRSTATVGPRWYILRWTIKLRLALNVCPQSQHLWSGRLPCFSLRWRPLA